VLTNANWANALALNGDTLWVASGGGALAWDVNSGEVTHSTTENGLIANHLTAVVDCPLPGFGTVFGGDQGIQILDQRGNWKTLTSGGNSLSHDDVSALACNIDSGLLVVGYAQHGIDIFRSQDGRWMTVGADAGLAADQVSALAINSAGAIGVASDAALSILQNQNVTVYNADNSPLQGEPLRSLAADEAGALWMVSGDRLLQLDGEMWNVFTAADVTGDFPFGVLIGAQPVGDGLLWLASEPGDLCLFDVQGKLCRIYQRGQPGMVAGPLTALTADSAERVAFASQQHGVSLFSADGWKPLIAAEPVLAGNRMGALASDDTGFIWAASDGGLQQINPQRTAAHWLYDADNSGLATIDIRAILDSRRGVWVGGRGASSFDGQRWTNYTVADGLAGEEVTSIAEDAQGRIWLGTRSGLSIWNGSSFFNLTTSAGLPNDDITALLAQDNGMWIGSNGGGLYRFEQNQLQVYTADNAGLPGDAIGALGLDAEGNLLVAANQQLVRFVDGEVSPFPDAPQATIRDLETDADGWLWVATAESGVFRFDGSTWRQLTGKDGLPDRAISALTMDDYGIPWIGGATGGVARLIHE
jgi:ligand-binding sensor domain-containing protein